MTSTIEEMTKKGLVTPPSFIKGNVHYETMVGSIAYGISTPDSDIDVCVIAIPPIDIIFPHHAGVILGYDLVYNKFEVYQEHGVIHPGNEREYDFTVYNIVKYFRMCADSNPSMIDALFTALNCILHCTSIGGMLRDNRKIFLSKQCYFSYKGYAYEQRSKIRKGANKSNPKRQADVVKYGFDTKFACNLVRLLNECEMILQEGDLDLRINSAQLKSIRKGEWTLEQIDDYFIHKEKLLEKLYVESKAVPDKVREVEIKQLLIDCLEHHYGSLDKLLYNQDKNSVLVQKIRELLNC